MRRLSLVLLATAMTIPLALPSASAQETQETGRYQLYQGAVEGEQGSLPVLLDTQYGRSWVLVREGDGYAWTRIPIIRMKQLGEHLLSQPAAATRRAPTPTP
jgi:hypothetical protein